MELNTRNNGKYYGENEAKEPNKRDRRRFNRPRSAGNSSFKKHNRLKFMLTERVRRLRK